MVSGSNVLLGSVTQVDPMYVIFGIPDREYLAIRRDVEAGRVKLHSGNRFKTSVKLADGTAFPASGQLNFTDVLGAGSLAYGILQCAMHRHGLLDQTDGFLRLAGFDLNLGQTGERLRLELAIAEARRFQDGRLGQFPGLLEPALFAIRDGEVVLRLDDAADV